MRVFNPKELATHDFHQILLGTVIPRPIALASTVDANGIVNLSPFSFFNCFSANPPILVFSPARRVRNNTTKHTLENILETKEVVINIVNYAMVEQTSLSSVEFDKGIDEFVKSGLTAVQSKLVTPPRVKESPVSFECKVKELIPLGEQGGAGHLVICEVVLVHVDDAIFDSNNTISPKKLDVVARLGGDWYCRVNGQSLFKVSKPGTKLAVGFEKLPESLLKSEILNGNHLARMASVEAVPELTDEEFADWIGDLDQFLAENGQISIQLLHEKLKYYIEEGFVELAWKLLLAAEKITKNRKS
ncbi:flavin reductase [Flavobacterium sp. L1I52]|uniref:Flavin reductase n=1 Tax=Flavobacterium pokkalii TaxID=1940408 RepID=A0ABR7URB4_9FLAO|nr:flavin reductase family protein [Flavobacterium pokkalii]MBD0725459.1 flavin reductase [Flavobacterium pokkalii]